MNEFTYTWTHNNPWPRLRGGIYTGVNINAVECFEICLMVRHFGTAQMRGSGEVQATTSTGSDLVGCESIIRTSYVDRYLLTYLWWISIL